MENLGFQEILIIVVPIAIPFFVIKLIYNYDKNKGRLEELEKRIKNENN